MDVEVEVILAVARSLLLPHLPELSKEMFL